MKTGYNELVGIQVRCSKVIKRYNVTHFYRWKNNGDTAKDGSTRSFDMRRDIPIRTLCRNLRDVYAPAICSIWRQVTQACYAEYLQFEPDLVPAHVDLGGDWQLWAEL